MCLVLDKHCSLIDSITFVAIYADSVEETIFFPRLNENRERSDPLTNH